MSNLRALHPSAVTPKFILEQVAARAEEFKTIYVVAFDEQGKPTVWGGGKLSECALAGAVLSDLAVSATWSQPAEEPPAEPPHVPEPS